MTDQLTMPDQSKQFFAPHHEVDAMKRLLLKWEKAYGALEEKNKDLRALISFNINPMQENGKLQDALKNKDAELKAVIANLGAEMRSLTSALDESKRKNDLLEKELRSQLANGIAEKEGFQAEHAKLRAELANAIAEKKDLQAAHAKLRAEMDIETSEGKKYYNENAKLKATIAKLKAEMQEKTNAGVLKARIAKLKADLQEKTEEGIKFYDETEELKNQLKKQTSALNKAHMREHAVAQNAKDRIRSLEEEKKEKHAQANRDINALEERNGLLEKQLESAKTMISSSQNHIDALTAKYTAIRDGKNANEMDD